MQLLLSTLDEEVALLEDLVACTQKEQQHLLAFEPAELEAATEAKQRLLDREANLRTRREHGVENALRAAGAPPEARTLGDLCRLLAEPARTGLGARRDRLKALLGALAELNIAAGIHAERQLRWVRSCRRAMGAREGHAYGPSGRIDTTYGAGHCLSTRA